MIFFLYIIGGDFLGQNVNTDQYVPCPEIVPEMELKNIDEIENVQSG